MEQLPESLIYFTKRLTNYSVNTVKLQSLNTQKLASNGATQLRVALPVNSIVNMKSFSMVGTVRTYGVAEQGGNSNPPWWNPRINGPYFLVLWWNST